MSASDVHGKGAPSAPPLSLMDVIPGYESTGTFDDLPPPQPGFGVPGQNPNPPVPHWNIPSISEDVAKEVFIDYASSKCCYGTRPAKELVFTDLQPYNTFRLSMMLVSRMVRAPKMTTGKRKLKTLSIAEQVTVIRAVEKGDKKTVEIAEQFGIPTSTLSTFLKEKEKILKLYSEKSCGHQKRMRECQIADAFGAPSPSPWTIVVQVPELFKDNKTDVRVPHTSSVKVYPVVGFPDDSINQASEKALRDHQVLFAPTCRILQQSVGVAQSEEGGLRIKSKEKIAARLSLPSLFLVYFIHGQQGGRSRVPTVSEDVAREALIQYAGSKWTWSRKPARELVFEELKPFTIYRYRLETFTESRATAWVFEPFTGQLVDGPQYGIPPLPWDVAVEVPPMHKDIEEKVRVPHTSSVKFFQRRNVTLAMEGEKSDAVTAVDGERYAVHRALAQDTVKGNDAHGAMELDAEATTIQGFEACIMAALTRHQKNQIYEHVPNRCPDFPIKLFEKVNGDKFFVDENIFVYPIVGFPDEEICEASKKGNQEHLAKFSKMRILQQRQTIELVPLTQAFYKYKDQQYNYYVYGTENQVHAAKYPTNCTLL
ncbi:SSUH2 protein, partial [Polypterus senegalus]|nr:SSUH2 protein [Polypterus senegalus]